METTVDHQLPKFERRGRTMRVNFDEEEFIQESEGSEPKTMWRYTTAEFSPVASMRERVEAIIRTRYPTDSSELRASETREYRDLVDRADILARESFGQILSGDYVREMQRRKLQRERDTALQGMTHTFDDGAVVQVRPQDLSNFQTAVADGEPQNWIMEDNTVRMTTVEEMQTAMASGVTQGKTIWNDYADKVKALSVDINAGWPE